MPSNRQWILRHRPVGAIKPTDLELVTADTPACGEGEVLVKNLYISIDPTHRIWMGDKPQYMPCVGLGEVMRALTGGIVEESNFEGLAKGDYVCGVGMCQDYFVGPGAGWSKLSPPITLPDAMGPYSLIIGLTAYHGTLKICAPKAGETFVVSGAAGAVGSLSGQIAKIAGARVIGVVGSEEKAKWITEELGFDGAINYKTDDVQAKLAELAPNGVDCYFENVGGAPLEAVLALANNNCRIAVCGLIDQYNTSEKGPVNFNMILMRRINIQGFICLDHAASMPEMMEYMVKHISEGSIKFKMDVQEGLENYVQVVNMLFEGTNSGKLVLKA